MRAEFHVHGQFLKYLNKKKWDQSRGNAFAQAQHDGGTGANGKKFQVVAQTFVDPDFACNLTLCIAFARSLNNSDIEVASLLRSMSLKRLGRAFTSIHGSTIADAAAAGVAGVFKHWKEICKMHSGNKLFASGSGALVRIRSKVPVNPFPEGDELMKSASQVFLGHNTDKSRQCLTQVTESMPTLKDQVCLKLVLPKNGTRIAATVGMLHTLARMEKILRVAKVVHTVTWTLTDEQWDDIRDFEAVGTITAVVTKVNARGTSTCCSCVLLLTCFICLLVQLAQFESLYTGAYGPLILGATYRKLTATHISVIDAPNVTKKLPVPRTAKAVSELSTISQEMLRRTVLEFQRRYCGNTTETVIDGLPLIIGDRELVVTYLDLRTLGASHLTSQQRRRAKDLLRIAYIKFAEVYNKFEVSDTADASSAASASTPSPSTAWIHRESLSVGAGIVVTAAHSSDESDADEGDGARQDYGAEFDVAYAAWKALHKSLDWRSLQDFASDLPTTGPLDVIDDLLPLNVAPTYKKLIDSGKYGLIPTMAVASTYTIGSLNGESFSERVISAANLVLDEGNTALNDEELEMMVILRIDRKFMQFMRAKYAHVHHEAFKGGSVLREDENESDSDGDLEDEDG